MVDVLPRVSVTGGRQTEADYVSFTVSLSQPATDAVTVDYRTVAGTAMIRSDLQQRYSSDDPLAGTVTFAPGEDSRTIRIYAAYDTLDERDEGFSLELSHPVGATLGGGLRAASATGWVLDDDGAGADRSMAVSAPVIAENGGQAVFTVSLSEAFSGATTFTYSTFDGSGKAGSDYVGRAGTVSFAAGQTEATVAVSLRNDGAAEAAETFGLKVNGASGVPGAVGTAQVLDDDAAAPVLSIEGGRNVEGQYVEFTVRLSRPAPDGVTVNYQTHSGTALADEDVSRYYSSDDGLSGTVTFAPGEDTQTIRLYARTDTADELDESFAVELSSPAGATFGAGLRTLIATGWVLDDDGVGLDRALSVSAPVVSETAGKAVFTISLSEPLAAAGTFTYATYDGAAKAGADYVAKSGSVTFAAGQTEATVEVGLVNDGRVEAAEGFGLRVDGAQNVRGAVGVAEILNDDGPVPVLSIDGDRNEEGNYVEFTLRLSKPASDVVTVGYQTHSGSALTQGDVSQYYSSDDALAGTVTFAPGEDTQTIRLYARTDTADELDENVSVELFSPAGATFGGGQAAISATGWVLDDDGPGLNRALSVSAPVVHENAGTAVFTVSLSEPLTSATTFSYATYDGAAKAGEDYAGTTGTVTFAAGQTEAAVEVKIVDNARLEANEGFGLKVNGAQNVRGAVGTAEILDNDSAAPVLSLAGDSNVEGSYVTFTLRLSKPAVNAVTVDYRTLAGTAELNSDIRQYFSSDDALAGTVTFAPGEDTQTIRLYAGTDNLDELDESFAVELSRPAGATFGGGQRTLVATGWVLDDDGAAINRTVTVTGANVFEKTAAGAGTAVFGIDLSEASTTPVTLNYTLQNGTALAGRDYVGGNGSVTFAVGQTHAEVSVQLLADVAREGDETFTLAVSPSYPAQISPATAPARATAVVRDGTIFGTPGNDVISGTETSDRIEGLGGNDRLLGLPGNDFLIGGAGNDSLNGGAGRDLMLGGAGNDSYAVDDAGDRVIETANQGYDTVYSDVNWTLGANFERLVLSGAARSGTGNAGNNVLVGTGAANTLNGLAGNDVIIGAGGNDRLIGGAGNDSLGGGAGADTMYGGLGDDGYAVDAAGDRTLEGSGGGYDTVFSTIDWTLGANLERLVLAGAAAIDGTGNAAGNVIAGNRAANVLSGQGGNDALYGGAGNDVLSGGIGNDVLNGGTGFDRLFGGQGADQFVFASAADSAVGPQRDRILDFTHGADRVNLAAIDASTQFNGNQAFDFIGGGAFHGAAGELRFAGGVLAGDLNGDGRADFEIAVSGVGQLFASDLIL